MHLWASHITPGGHYMRDYACASMNLRRQTANEKKNFFKQIQVGLLPHAWSCRPD